MKTILITGTTNGIGKVCALELAQKGHHIIMANRNEEKSAQVASEITDQTGNTRVECLTLDLASLASVKRCSAEFLERHSRLDVLLNNAGLMSTTEVITEDGYELQFAVNNLAQLQLTMGLLPALEAAAPSQVIFVTSMMHRFGKLDFASFKGGSKYNGGTAYNQSKLAMMMIARELAERLRERQIAVNSLHPGAVNTGILDNYSRPAQFFLRRMFISPEKGARTSLYLAGLEGAEIPTGEYYANCKTARTNPLVADKQARQKLWDTCGDYLELDAQC